MRSCCSLALALALAACAPPGTAPEPAGTPALYTAGELGLAFVKPVNWPARITTRDGSPFVLVEAGRHERLVVSRLPDATAPLERLEARVAHEVAARFPGTTTAPSRSATVAGRPALRTAVGLEGGQRGVRYVVSGGWLVEYQSRLEQAAVVTPAFEQMVATLRLP